MKQSLIRNLALSSQLKLMSISEHIRIKPQFSQRIKQLGFFGFTFIMIVVILAALGGVALWVKTKINILEKEKLELTVVNKELVAENSRITEVNRSNVFIIEQLNKDKARANKIVADLKQQRQKDAITLTNMRESIRKIIKNDPSNDGTVSPVLKQTIESIINNRYPPAKSPEPTKKKKGV